MKRLLNLFTLSALFAGTILLTGCPGSDTIPPKIYFTQAQDTTVLLQTPLADPGVYVEDNKDVLADITVTSDFDDVISLNSNGDVRSAGVFEVTYTATDLAGNTSEDIRTITVLNVAEVLAGSYDVNGNYENINDTLYSGSISADRRDAGKIRFSKSYLHSDNGDLIYLKVEGWLYSDEYSLDITNSAYEADEDFGWMALPEDPDVPYFYDMTPEAAMELIPRYTYLDIPTQTVADSTGQVTVTFKGQTEEDGKTPRSRITYVGNQVSKIELKVNVTKNGMVDRVTEIYTPK
jgi:hypothetical protein